MCRTTEQALKILLAEYYRRVEIKPTKRNRSAKVNFRQQLQVMEEVKTALDLMNIPYRVIGKTAIMTMYRESL